MISIKGEWISSNIEQRVTDASTGLEMRKYIMGRFKWNEESFDCVNWEAIEQASRGCSKKENIMVSKLMFDWINSGHQKAKMEQEKGMSMLLSGRGNTGTYISMHKQANVQSTE